MKIVRQSRNFLCSILILCCFCGQTYANTEIEDKRLIVFVSDFHLGLGQVDGEWHPYEDFRWPNALNKFLQEITHRGNDQVDLVIVGDFLELWQVPDDVSCKGSSADFGCRIEEVEKITRRIITAHSGNMEDGSLRAIDSFRNFSKIGNNKIHIIPGNHDAGLMISSVWKILLEALGGDADRILLVGPDKKGVWTSPDGKLVAEHGHQMGADLNKYKNWPLVYDEATNLMQRVGGERNVQKIFNDVERDYPIIDNLSPHSKGAWYRMQDVGVWGSVADVARLMTFIIFETSIKQKIDTLGEDQQAGGELKWDLEYARKELGFNVLAMALEEDDPIRVALQSDEPSEKIKKLKTNLNIQVRHFEDKQLSFLCDQLALRGEVQCKDATLGYAIETMTKSRTRVKREHLTDRLQVYKDMKVFIYGHTHKLEEGHNIDIDGDRLVKVFNTGAFQRIISDESYRESLAEKYPNLSPAEGLSKFDLEKDLNPCYTAVIAEFTNEAYKLKTQRWYAAESGAGSFVDVGDPRCD